MNDLISRQAAIDALNGIINRFEQILRDIRESKVDDSVCGMCEYDGAFVGQSGDWCNECPGFEKDDCFRLSDECRKRWLESVELPAAQPEKRTDKHTKMHACDCISRQAAIDATWFEPSYTDPLNVLTEVRDRLKALPSAQPEIIRCRECKWWDRCPSSTIAPLYHLCRRVGRMNMTADDFCSRAEQWEVSE